MALGLPRSNCNVEERIHGVLSLTYDQLSQHVSSQICLARFYVARQVDSQLVIRP